MISNPTQRQFLLVRRHFAERFARNYKRLLDRLRPFIPRTEDREDVLQEVFTRDFLGHSYFGAIDVTDASFVNAMRDRALQLYRDSKGRPLAVKTDLNAEVADPAEDADREIAIELVKASLQQLSATMQCVLILHLEGWSSVEIAEKLGLSAGAVSQLTRRARAKLIKYVSSELDLLGKEQKVWWPPRGRIEGDDQGDHALTLQIEPGTAPAWEIDDFLDCLNEVYVALGGTGLQFDSESESPR
jgi:RNA polymerase sigma factor (sigma-70 family)